MNVKLYLAEVRADLAELKISYRLDFFQHDSPGLRLVRHIVFERLPHNFRREVIHRAGKNYPTLNDVFEHSGEAKRTLAKTKRVNPYRNSKNKNNRAEKQGSAAILENFSASSNGPYCKLCARQGHLMTKRKRFPNTKATIEQCSLMHLYLKCASEGHNTDRFPRTLS